MKKLISILLAGTLAFSLLGCGAEKTSGDLETRGVKYDKATDDYVAVASANADTTINNKASGADDIQSQKLLSDSGNTNTAKYAGLTIGQTTAMGVVVGVPVYLVNDSGATIEDIFIVQASSTTWGNNLNDGYVLPAGCADYYTIVAYNDPLYDIAINYGGVTVTYTNCDFSGMSSDGFTLYAQNQGGNYVLSW